MLAKLIRWLIGADPKRETLPEAPTPVRPAILQRLGPILAQNPDHDGLLLGNELYWELVEEMEKLNLLLITFPRDGEPEPRTPSGQATRRFRIRFCGHDVWVWLDATLPDDEVLACKLQYHEERRPYAQQGDS